MSRAVSIHIGVNRPWGCGDRSPLLYAESSAWRMAELASQAGYGSIQMLRGAEATRKAVHEALSHAAGTLTGGDTLLVSFSGHGGQVPDGDQDEPTDGHDESWCLHDGELLDDTLSGYWRLFDRGVRIVVVSESCHGAGMTRTGHGLDGEAALLAAAYDEEASLFAAAYDEEDPLRGGELSPWDDTLRGEGDAGNGAAPGASCIDEPPRDACEIRASVLMLAAAGEDQEAQDGLFTRFLLDIWNDGTFRKSYCELYWKVRAAVMHEKRDQKPQIHMLGAASPEFPLAPAFHVERQAVGADDGYLDTYRGASRGGWAGWAG